MYLLTYIPEESGIAYQVQAHRLEDLNANLHELLDKEGAITSLDDQAVLWEVTHDSMGLKAVERKVDLFSQMNVRIRG